MTKQIVAVVLGAVVLFVAVAGTVAFTGGDSDGGNGHTMPGGQMMTGGMHTMERPDDDPA